MVAHCDSCEVREDTPTVFDSHDGGAICVVCDKVFCPKCEVEHFSEERTGADTCNSCLALDKAKKDAILVP